MSLNTPVRKLLDPHGMKLIALLEAIDEESARTVPNPMPHLKSDDPRFMDRFDRGDEVVQRFMKDNNIDFNRGVGWKYATSQVAQVMDVPMDKIIGTETHLEPNTLNRKTDAKTSSKLPLYYYVDGIYMIVDGNHRTVQAFNAGDTSIRGMVVDANASTNEAFSTTQTGMPTFDDMIEKPEYFRDAKRKEFEIVTMSPDEYIERAVSGFDKFAGERNVTRDTLMRSRDPALIDEYAKALMAGDEFPMVVLDYTRGDFSQEGLHRAAAALKAGMDEIPVMIVNDAEPMNEAPIRDFTVDDSVFYKGSQFPQRDQNILDNPKAEVLARKKIKTAVPIDLVFLGFQPGTHSQWVDNNKLSRAFKRMLDQYSGVVEPGDFADTFGTAVKPTSDGITAVYLSNANDVDSAVPMTPWIMMHRLSHSLLDAAVNGGLGNSAKLNVNPFRDINPQYLTTRSAREDNIGSGEESVEALTQYLVTGKITMAWVVERNDTLDGDEVVLSNGRTVWDSEEGFDPEEDPIDPMDEMLLDLEEQLNISAGIIVQAAIGKLVVAP